MLEHIRIVLVNTSHPGNIGAVARAMKTMGLNKLFLVQPEKFPHPKAEEMAANAGEVLQQAVVVEHLDSALADCSLILGTSARSRNIPWPLLTPREMSAKVRVETKQHEVAILFGREQSGLTNEELQRCHYHIQIPTHPAYPVLNIAAAVQVIAYELYLASLEKHTIAEKSWDYRLATDAEMENFFQHLEKVLIDLDFLKESAPRKLMPRLRRLFLRTRVDVMEMNILRGILTAISNSQLP